MDTKKVQMHEYKAGEVMQLKYFIKKLQGAARREAWSKFQDTMSFASEAAVQELWAHIDIAVELASKPAEVAKKPRVERKHSKVRKTRTPKVTAEHEERAYPCPTCDTGECLPKPKGKGRWPICPACHKAGKKVKRVPPMSILRPAPLVLEIRNPYADLPVVKLPVKTVKPRNWRNSNVYLADMRGQIAVREAMSRHQRARFGAHK